MLDWLFKRRRPVPRPIYVSAVTTYGRSRLFAVIDYADDTTRYRSLIHLVGAGGRVRRRPCVYDEVRRAFKCGSPGERGEWHLFIGGEEFILWGD